MKQVLLAPDKFKGSLTAAEVANAAELLRRIGRTIAAAPTDVLTMNHQGGS